jgi:hypothetical protein
MRTAHGGDDDGSKRMVKDVNDFIKIKYSDSISSARFDRFGGKQLPHPSSNIKVDVKP